MNKVRSRLLSDEELQAFMKAWDEAGTDDFAAVIPNSEPVRCMPCETILMQEADHG